MNFWDVKHIKTLWKRIPLGVKIILFIALLANVIANNSPIVIFHDGGLHFPLFTKNTSLNAKEWKAIDAPFYINTPIAYDDNHIDQKNAHYVGPFDKQITHGTYYRHWLGTDEIGRDVLARTIYGVRNSLFVGLAATMLSAFLGLIIGGIAGFWGDRNMRVGILNFLFIIITMVIFLFYLPLIFSALKRSEYFIAVSLLIGTLFISTLILKYGFKLKLNSVLTSYTLPVPISFIITRLMDVLNAIPNILIVLPILIYFKPSYSIIILVLGLTGWTSKARIVKGEVMRIKAMPFVDNLKLLGMKPKRIFFYHALPNTWKIFWASVPFTLVNCIIAEATLSFLGVGLPTNSSSLGTILYTARENISAWWCWLPAAILIIYIAFSLRGRVSK